MRKPDIMYEVLFLALLFCYFMYSIYGIYGFELIPDEFGYWSYAAMLSGCDWSEVLSLGSYYSFGYTLILYPVFRIFRDSLTAYRMAVAVNFVLLAVAFFVLKKLLARLRGTEHTRLVSLAAAIAILYPPWLYYSRMTMTETVVMCMYVIICMLLNSYLEKGRLCMLMLLFVSLVYSYTVHMRTIGIFLAAVLILVLHFYREFQWRSDAKKQENEQTQGHRKHHRYSAGLILLAVVAGILLVAASGQIKSYISEHIYVEGAGIAFSVNDYSGQAEKIRSIFTARGLQNLLVSLTGKFLYLGLASFGLFYWGTWFCIHKFRQEGKLIYLFFLLAAIGEIAVTAIYTIENGGRIDSLTYGRYNEQILPVMMALGCLAVGEMKKGCRVYRVTCFIAVVQLPMLWLISDTVRKQGLTNIHAYMISGISYLYDGECFEPDAFHMSAYLAGILLMTAVTGILYFSINRKNELLLVTVLALELLLGMRLAQNFSEGPQLANFRDIQILDTVQEELEEHARLVFLQEGTRAYADNLQFHLREAEIYLESDLSALSQEDLVVTDYLYSGLHILKQQYANWRIMGHLAVFYN